jgi:hypothetical protein
LVLKIIEVLWPMSVPTARQASNSDRVSLRRLLCATAAVPAAGLALMLAFTPEESAAAEVYTIAPGSHLHFAFDGNSEAVTGQFTLNAADTAVFSVDLVLSGNSPEAGTYDQFISSGATGFIAGTSSANANFHSGLGVYIGITGFTPAFGAPTVESAGNHSRFYSFTQFGGTSFSLPGVSAVDASLPGVPEPSSIAILGAALGFFGVRKPASRLRRLLGRGRQQAADGPTRSSRESARSGTPPPDIGAA